MPEPYSLTMEEQAECAAATVEFSSHHFDDWYQVFSKLIIDLAFTEGKGINVYIVMKQAWEAGACGVFISAAKAEKREQEGWAHCSECERVAKYMSADPEMYRGEDRLCPAHQKKGRN